MALSSEEEVAAVPEALGVDGGALRSSPCAAQLVLLPFGEDKEDLDDYDRYTGPLDSGKALQVRCLG